MRDLPSQLKRFGAFLVGLCLIALPARSAYYATSQEGSADARLDRIVNRLLPAAIIKGQPLPFMRLPERMKYYNAPGVIIAFSEHGKVAGPRVYGTPNRAKNPPET